MALNNTQIKNFKPKTKLYRKLDKDGLYIEVAVSGTKSWIHRYSFNNKPTMRVIGRYDDKTMTLLKAREILLDDKRLLREGFNPKDIHSQKLNSIEITFKDVFLEWHSLQSNTWSPAYAKDVVERVSNYLLPFIGSKSVCDITTQEMKAIFKKNG